MDINSFRQFGFRMVDPEHRTPQDKRGGKAERVFELTNVSAEELEGELLRRASQGETGGYITSANPQVSSDVVQGGGERIQGGFPWMAIGALAPILTPLIEKGANWIYSKIKGKPMDEEGKGLFYDQMVRNKKHLKELESTLGGSTHPLKFYRNVMTMTGKGLSIIGFDDEDVSKYVEHMAKHYFGLQMGKKILESDLDNLTKKKLLKRSDLLTPILMGRGIHRLIKNGTPPESAQQVAHMITQAILEHPQGKKYFDKVYKHKGGSIFGKMRGKLRKFWASHGDKILTGLKVATPLALAGLTGLAIHKSDKLAKMGSEARVKDILQKRSQEDVPLFAMPKKMTPEQHATMEKYARENAPPVGKMFWTKQEKPFSGLKKEGSWLGTAQAPKRPTPLNILEGSD